jgi:hypothetical protein
VWEFLHDTLISIDPDRAKDDPVIVKNIPYYKAKKAREEEVMKLDPPPRPSNWGELDLPLSPSSWGVEEIILLVTQEIHFIKRKGFC